MAKDRQAALRDHALYVLRGGGAHLDFENAIADLPPDLRGAVPEGLPYAPWQLLEHVRLCQWDILEYSRSDEHVTPPWPEGFWPDGPAPPDADAWDRSVDCWREDMRAMQKLISDPAADLLAPLPWGEDPSHTLLREALLMADHNAYHTGQMVAVRRLLGAWEG
jgi:hypothetical protein